MAGGTHVFDMIKRLKENEALRKLNYFKKTEKKIIRSKGPIEIDPQSWSKQDRDKSEGRMVADVSMKRKLFRLVIMILAVASIVFLLVRILN